jgi:hypothetical protein
VSAITVHFDTSTKTVGETSFELVPTPLQLVNIRRIPIDRVRELSVEEKKHWLEGKCEERRESYQGEYLSLVIEREHLVRDSFYQYMTTDGFDFHKRLKIHLDGECGQDEDTLRREWIT